MGRGPKDIRAHLTGNLQVVRLHCVMTSTKQHFVQSLSPEKGCDVPKQVRTQLIETANPVVVAMVQKAINVKVTSMHHDISTITGEEPVVFTLVESPIFRDT